MILLYAAAAVWTVLLVASCAVRRYLLSDNQPVVPVDDGRISFDFPQTKAAETDLTRPGRASIPD